MRIFQLAFLQTIESGLILAGSLVVPPALARFGPAAGFGLLNATLIIIFNPQELRFLFEQYGQIFTLPAQSTHQTLPMHQMIFACMGFGQFHNV